MNSSEEFDIWAEDYDKAVVNMEMTNKYPFVARSQIFVDIIKEVKSKKNARIIDMGCGTGELLSLLSAFDCEVFGQDFSPKMLEKAKKRVPNAKLYVGDFEDGLVKELDGIKFDYIIGTYVFHHLPDDKKVSFFKALKDRLNENGKILIGDVIFQKREDIEKCKKDEGERWDDEEEYCVVDELQVDFPNLEFIKESYCSGLLKISNECRN